MSMSTDEEVPWSGSNNEIPWANSGENSNNSIQVGGSLISGQFTQTNATLALVLSSFCLLYTSPSPRDRG